MAAGVIGRILLVLAAGVIGRILFVLDAGVIGRILFVLDAGVIGRILLALAAGVIGRILLVLVLYTLSYCCCFFSIKGNVHVTIFWYNYYLSNPLLVPNLNVIN